MYEQICASSTEEAKRSGLAVVVWTYPRGAGSPRRARRPSTWSPTPRRSPPSSARTSSRSSRPTAHIEQDEAKKVYEKADDPDRDPGRARPPRRAGAFDGKRIVIFSGGEEGQTRTIFDEVRGIRDGGGFGSIIGRNSFQRPQAPRREVS